MFLIMVIKVLKNLLYDVAEVSLRISIASKHFWSRVLFSYPFYRCIKGNEGHEWLTVKVYKRSGISPISSIVVNPNLKALENTTCIPYSSVISMTTVVQLHYYCRTAICLLRAIFSVSLTFCIKSIQKVPVYIKEYRTYVGFKWDILFICIVPSMTDSFIYI